MRRAIGIPALVMLAGLALAGCSGGGDPVLMHMTGSSGNGPDEFAIVPNRPLQMPPDLAALPPPTPGASNRADLTPRADLVAALGGNPAALGRQGVPAADAAVFRHATRFGVSQDIRQQLAAEDLAFRSENRGRPLERLFNVNVYFQAYAPMSLDQHAELERWRARGLATPAAPPEPEDR
jgi:hypothetical protein